MSNAVGFLIVAALASKIQPLLGRQYSFMLGIFLSAIHFSIVSAGSHFALTVAAFAFGGAGLAMCLAQTNVFLANLEKLTLYLSYTHGAYGLGATISPLLGTLIASHGIPWHFVYLINLGQMVISFVLVGLAFQGSEKDLRQFEADSTEDEVSDRSSSSNSTMREAVTNRITWIFAFLILFYQGSEVSISGWCVTYLIDYKGGDINSIGYVALAFGLVLLWEIILNPSIGKIFRCEKKPSSNVFHYYRRGCFSLGSSHYYSCKYFCRLGRDMDRPSLLLCSWNFG